MKVLNILVLNVTIKQNLSLTYQRISNPNMRVSNFPVTNVTIQQHKEVIYQAISNPNMRVSKTSYQVSIYQVVINEQYKVKLHCDFILSPGDFLGLLGAHHVRSI